MHRIHLEKNLLEESHSGMFVTFPFYKDNKILADVNGGMTLKKCGSMRFRWNETNPNRDEKLDFIKSELQLQKKDFIPVELIHSKSVYEFSKSGENTNLTGDGIITTNSALIPTVTVADCMPLFLYEPKTGVFGVVHSGWKGTGIIGEAISLAEKNHNSKPEDFSVVIGPHIHDCCYIVNEERAQFFAENFTPDCVKELEEGGNCYCGGKGLPVVWNNGSGKLFRLSLEKANLSVLKKIGVKDENITIIDECTCCNQLLGSNRRETAEASFAGKEIPVSASAIPVFTVQSAFVFQV